MGFGGGPRSVGYLFCIVLLSLHLASTSFGHVDKDCGPAFNLSAGNQQYPGHWALTGQLVSPIDVFAVPGSEVLHRNSPLPAGLDVREDETLLTLNFFERSGIPIPPSARKLRAFIYSYQPRSGDLSSKPEAGTRGSGRDIVVLVETSPDVFVPVSFKGSGTNDWYSAVNGIFDLNNFRRNGLQPLYEVVTEYVLLLQSYSSRIPAVDTPEIRLLPAIADFTGRFKSESVPAQTVRITSQPRDSMFGMDGLSFQRKLQFAAAIYRTNVGHGAINSENVARAEVLDPGHYGFGFPILSSVYRCSLCAKHRGSRHDGTMVGPLDYYFPAGKQRHSLGFETSSEVVEGVFAEVLHQLGGIHPGSKLQGADRVAFLNALQMTYSVARPERHRFQKAGDALLGRRLEWDRLVEVDFVLSMKFFIQLAALKLLLPEQESRITGLVTRIFQTLENRTLASNAHRLVRTMEVSLRGGKLGPKQLKELLAEYLPSYIVESEVRKGLAGVPMNTGFAGEMKARVDMLVERLRRPVENDPIVFLEKLEKHF